MCNYFKSMPSGILISKHGANINFYLSSFDNIFSFSDKNNLSIINPTKWNYDIFFHHQHHKIPAFSTSDVKIAFSQDPDNIEIAVIYYAPSHQDQLDKFNEFVMWLRNNKFHVFHYDIFSEEYSHEWNAA